MVGKYTSPIDPMGFVSTAKRFFLLTFHCIREDIDVLSNQVFRFQVVPDLDLVQNLRSLSQGGKVDCPETAGRLVDTQTGCVGSTP